MKRAALALAAVLALPASALDFELGAGHTNWTKPPNSQYWQNGFQNSWDTTSTSYYLGVTDKWNHEQSWLPKNIRWRLGYTRLGSIRGQALAVTDESYNHVDGCVPSGCSPLSNFISEGSTKGIVATLAPEWHIGKGVNFFLEGGPYLHRPKIDIAALRVTFPPEYVNGFYHYKSGWNLGYTLGFGFDYTGTQLTFSWWRIDAVNRDHPVNDNIPPPSGSRLKDTFNIGIRQRF